MKSSRVYQVCVVIIFILFDLFDESIERSIETNRRNRRAAVGLKWPSNRIPYSISSMYRSDDRAYILDSLKQFENLLIVNGKKCLEFVERDQSKDNDYILIANDGDCSSGVGYFRGINRVSIGTSCLVTGTIMHEIMHRIGFDHEHSRYDRDNNILVLLNNTSEFGSSATNFEKNAASNQNMSYDTPYDFFSVTHYNSDALTKSSYDFSILTKFPALMNVKNEIFYERNSLSKLDIYQIQRFYDCPTLSEPNIVKMQSFADEKKIAKARERFDIETSFENVDEKVKNAYLQRTYRTCGMNHFWPSEYPLVENDNELYKFVCEPKKWPGERCRFSIECQDEDAVCVRLFFKTIGNCFLTDNQKINEYGQKVNDKFFEAAKKVKETVKSSYRKIKGWFSKLADSKD